MADPARLAEIDAMLADLTPRYRTAVAAVTDALPGISGRPAGNGDPPSGGGGGTTSVTERTALTHDRTLDRTLDRLHRLPHDCAIHADDLAGAMGVPAIGLPTDPQPHQELAYTAGCVLLCIGLANTHGTRIPDRRLHDLWNAVSELQALVHRWGGERPSTGHTAASPGLAADLTGRWCRSCLRIGHRAPRTDRYPAGVCRWCGDWHAHHGWWPTPGLLAAHRDGTKITPALVAAAKRERR